jgi:hypothetical protein
MINEHDFTKKILNSIRNQKLIREQEEGQPEGYEEAHKAEKEKFMKIVTPMVTFKSFNIYPDTGNVVFSGQLDSGIDWEFSKKDGLFVNAPNMELDDDALETLKDLNAYYIGWKKEWAMKMNTEYSNKNEEI